MSKRIQQLFSDISPTYDQLNHVLSFNIDKAWRKKTVRQIRFDPSQPIQALDLCAGTLDLTSDFIKYFKNAKVWAADFCFPMLKAGLDKIHDNDKARVQVVCADALKLPFADESFDVIFCGYGFRNLDDKELGLKEMQRVLKKGGQLLILEFFRPVRLASRLFHGTYGNFILPTVGKIISGNGAAYRYLHESIGSFYSLNECRDLFQKQGFTNVTSNEFLMGISSLITGQKQAA